MANAKMTIRCTPWLLAILLCGAGCSHSQTASTANDKALRKVTLGLNWYPEVEHGGFFAAHVHGYFAEEGLDVEILRGGPESPIVPQVASGERMFGVANADIVLFGRAEQAPVVSVMAPLQTSPRCLIVHESSGIKRFEDLTDITLGMSSTQAFAHYLRTKAALRGVKIVPYSGNVAQFLADPHYAQQGYVFSEPYIAKSKGGDPHVLMLADLGFNPYTSLLITSEQLIRKEPELVRKMVRASIRGWQKYLDEPIQTNAKIHAVNPEMELDVLEFGAKKIRELVLTEESQARGIGVMTNERWRTLGEQFLAASLIQRKQLDTVGAFTCELLPNGGHESPDVDDRSSQTK